MKKIIIFFTLFYTLICGAQPVLTDNSMFDDFSTAQEYNEPATGRGIYWWGSAGSSTVDRNEATNELIVHATQGVYQYNPFGVGFGDDNGALPGGVPFTIDLTNDGTWSFDITNYGTEDLHIRVACQDIEDTVVDCSPIPTPAGVAFDNLNVWAYQTQIRVPAGQTVTFNNGTPNDAGNNRLNVCDFTQMVWGDWGVWDNVSQTHIGAGVRKRCDMTQIKGFLITPLNAAKNTVDYHNLALTNGHFGISNFRVGNITTTSTKSNLREQDFKVYPNPATKTIRLKRERSVSSEENSISIRNSIGKTITLNTTPISDTEIEIDISHLPSGIYYLGEQSQKLIITN
jgi:hypothetical protein